MPSKTSPKYAIGDHVLIKPHQVGANWTEEVSARVVGFETDNPFCQTCHCEPLNAEHAGDGSTCCPGPWYVLVFECPDCSNTHRVVYAEHELTSRCKECGNRLDEHIDPATGCSVWATDADGNVLTITDEQAARLGLT